MEGFLPAPVGAEPTPSTQVVSCAERGVGIGGIRGIDRSAGFPSVALKGLRLDALVRFRLWGADLQAAEDAVVRLQDTVAAAPRDPRLPAMNVADLTDPISATIPAGTFWSSHVDYRVLFEHRFADADDAGGLIATIPVDGLAERFTVRDAMARWDDQAAPDLRVTAGGGLNQVGAVEVLFTLQDGWTGPPVTLETRTGGIVRRTVYPSVRAFTDDASAGTTDPSVTLGGIPHRPGRLDLAGVFPPGPVPLVRAGDAVTVSCAAPALADAAVLYLRLRS
jgi:hypothetical protein